MEEKKRAKLPEYVYINPADAGDEAKYAVKAARLNDVAGRRKYEGYVRLDNPNRSAVICILN